MVALQAPVELGWWLITAPCLEKPPACLVMPTLRAFDFRSRKSIQLILLVTDDLDRCHGSELLLCGLHHGPSGFVGIAAVITDVRNRHFMLPFDLLKSESRTAFWAELQSEPLPN